ncbi:Poly [ADP-ribose] polymerase 2 [Mortierella claussenii]|nr:Poly [ADP-ribose] polymerase 2 [Mortierella claussenii]
MPPKRVAAAATPATPAQPIFADCIFALAGIFPGYTHGQVHAKITAPEAGGAVATAVTKTTTHLITNQAEISKNTAKIAKAATLDSITLVKLEWIIDSIAQKKKLDIQSYKLDLTNATPSSPDTVMATAADVTDAVDTDVKEEKEKEKEKPVSAKNRKRKSDSEEEAEDEAEDQVDKKIKALKTKVAKSSGSAKIRQPPVDRACALSATYSVYVDSEVAWNARLNQTNIGHNNNKFYLIQLLQSKSGQYAVFSHWGRVGAHGQSSIEMYSDVDVAKRGFDKKFRDKTKNAWAARDSFVKYSGKYHLLPPDDGDSDDEDEDADGAKVKKVKKEEEKEEEKPIPESKLDPKVQDLMSLIFNTQMMNRQMKELDYDADKMPLGKLAKATILHGYEVLKQISAVLDKATPNYNLLSELSSEFYTVIPHNFGRNVPPVIKDAQTLKKKLEMLEALGEIEIAQKLMKENKKADEALTINPLDQQFASLKLDKLVPMDKESERFKLIQQYVKNSHGATHSSYNLEIDEVFDLARQGEDARFEESGFSKLHNRRLLWHGSRLTNYVGILSQGLRIAPPEAPATGYMFDKGAYFADCVSKSANYCFTDYHNDTGLMLLCEVALGDMFEIEQSDYNAKANSERAGKHSTKGLGQSYPSEQHDVFIEDNLRVQAGPLSTAVTRNNAIFRLQYNEYIVYNTSQIKMRYLLRMKFGYGHRRY